MRERKGQLYWVYNRSETWRVLARGATLEEARKRAVFTFAPTADKQAGIVIKAK